MKWIKAAPIPVIVITLAVWVYALDKEVEEQKTKEAVITTKVEKTDKDTEEIKKDVKELLRVVLEMQAEKKAEEKAKKKKSNNKKEEE